MVKGFEVTMKMVRLVLLLVLWLGVVLANPDIRAQTLKPLNIGLTGKTISTVFFEIGLQKGYYRQHGLDPKLIVVRQSDILTKAVLGGELNAMTILPTAVVASMRGLPIRTVAVTVDQAPYVFLGRPQVKTIGELRGKKLALSSLGGMTYYVVRSVLLQNRLDPDRDITMLAIGGTEARMGALSAGFVDATLVVAPLNLKLERQGYTRLAWVPDYVRFPLTGIAVTPEYLQSNRESVAALLKATSAAIAYVKQNKSDSVGFIKKYLEFSEEDAVNGYEFLIKNTPDKLIADDATMKQAMEFAGQSLNLKSGSGLDISKVRDWSVAQSIK